MLLHHQRYAYDAISYIHRHFHSLSLFLAYTYPRSISFILHQPVKEPILHYFLFYNPKVPKVFAIVFNIVKRFLDEYTLGKILIFKQESKKWLPKMLEHVDPSQIPKYFGGTQTDENGDPKCMHKVK